MKIKAIILKKSYGGLKIMNYLPIDVERAKELFYLDETSPSWLRNKVSKGKRKAGERAGSYSKSHQYWHVRMDGTMYQGHRIVTAIFNNEDPGPCEIDHIDGNKKNNNPANLRKATFELNRHNCGKRKTNYKGETPTSKYPGVYWDKIAKKWKAQIQHKGKKVHLGYFETELEAYKAYKAAKKVIMATELRESLEL